MATLSIDKSNWELVRLGDVAHEVRESLTKSNIQVDRSVGLEHIEPGDLHIRSWDEFDESSSFTKVFREGHVLFGRRRAYLKKAALADFNGVCSGDITVISASEDLLPSLLPFVVSSDSFFAFAVEHSAGGLSPRVKWKDLANYEFLLPPKDQQAEIAELLWAAEELKELRLLLQRLLKALMEVEFVALTSRGTGEIVELGSLFELITKKSSQPHSLQRYIGLEHIQPGRFFVSEWGNSSDVTGNAVILSKGDVGYSKLRPYLDKAFLADFDCLASTEILNLRPVGIEARTLLLILHSPEFLRFIGDKGYGTKMPRVNEKIIGAFKFRLPTDESAMLNRMSFYERALNEIELNLKSFFDLSSSLINQFFPKS